MKNVCNDITLLMQVRLLNVKFFNDKTHFFNNSNK